VIIDEEHLMPAKRELTMRQIRQILRLVRDGVSAREIGGMLGVARSTVQDNLKRAEAAGLANGSLSRYSPRKQTGWKRPISAIPDRVGDTAFSSRHTPISKVRQSAV
jgi:hypothetical protein